MEPSGVGGSEYAWFTSVDVFRRYDWLPILTLLSLACFISSALQTVVIGSVLPCVYNVFVNDVYSLPNCVVVYN